MPHIDNPIVDVLSLERMSSLSRDQQMVILVCNYLDYMGHKVKHGTIFDGYYMLWKYRPRLLFLANSIGAVRNFQLMKTASRMGMLGASMISEGNFKEGFENVNQFVWGWNKDKTLYEDVCMQWSKRTKKLTLDYSPYIKNKIKVSGGVGFDVYKISKNINPDLFLRKYTKEKYIKRIGVGCWDFGAYYEKDHRYKLNCKRYTLKEIDRFRKDQNSFNRILSKIISKNPDILFVLKEHPGAVGGRKASAIDGLEKFENTLIIKNEESVFDCINISDFWIVYESTTAMEAWLLGKQTCLLNPSGPDFPRDELYKGSICCSSHGELEATINSFYKNGELPGFKKLSSVRKSLIKDIIQWGDGLNHVRAGNEIISLLKNSSRTKLKTFSIVDVFNIVTTHLIWVLCPYLRFIPAFNVFYQRKKNFCLDVLSNNKKKRMDEQIAYYKKLGLSKEDLLKINCI
jgi:hypothetical protein